MPSPLPYTQKKKDISWIDVVVSARHTIYAGSLAKKKIYIYIYMPVGREEKSWFNKIFRVSDC